MKLFYLTLLTLSSLLFSPISTYASEVNIDYSVQEVSSAIYYHQGVHQDANQQNIGAIANVSFIIGERCVAVIDSGGSYLEGQLLRKAIKLKTELPVCYVINSHVHPDHTFGNAAFKADKPIYIGHEKLAAAMRARQAYFARTFEQLLGAAYQGTEFIYPDKTVSVNKPLTLDLGNRAITITAYPTSHTDHDITVFDNSSKTLWTGDLLFSERTPVIDGSINGWIKITKQFLTMEIDTVIPGHGPATAHWQQEFYNQLRYLTVIREGVRAIIADLGTIEQASAVVGLEEQSQWELYEDYHRRNVTASFVELEWE
ncbi:MBL fold metallo-hydrolase [Methylophaga sp. 41_12_T18]|nr:MBL fold metallo-hydrolase [Methylophaga sp. 41_12_T18]